MGQEEKRLYEKKRKKEYFKQKEKISREKYLWIIA
jgi:hypothetical protein